MVLITRQGLHSNLSLSNKALFLPKYVAFSLIRMFGLQNQLQQTVFLGWGDKYNYMAKHCNGTAQRRLASAGFRGSYRRSGFMFVFKCLNAEEDEGNNMLPKAQPSWTFFKSLVGCSLNGFKTNLPEEKHSSISECMSQNKCKRATAIKTPYGSFVQNKPRLLEALVLTSFIGVGDQSWVNRIHLTETIQKGILRQEHPIRL